MKNLDFLNKLKSEGKLEIVEPSEYIVNSYLIKSNKCTIAAKAVFDVGVYENAVSEAYYPMYNAVLALFFKCGIKCENHSAAAIIMRDFFKLEKLNQTFSKIKKERIDNQYYLTPENTEPLSKEKCKESLDTAQKFNAEILYFLKKINIKEITIIRKELEKKGTVGGVR